MEQYDKLQTQTTSREDKGRLITCILFREVDNSVVCDKKLSQSRSAGAYGSGLCLHATKHESVHNINIIYR
jgi:hypothetical protein